MKKVVLVDDHQALRTGLKEIVHSIDAYQVCGEASSASEGLSIIKKNKPDLAIVDLTLNEKQEGFGLVQDLCDIGQLTLVFSCHDEQYYAKRCIDLGARGYIMKTASVDEIIQAIETVVGGKIWVSDQMVGKMIEAKVTASGDCFETVCNKLSTEEFRIFNCLGIGEKNRSIAEKLGLKIKSVETKIRRIRMKLGYDSTEELCKFAYEWTKSHT